VLEERGADEVAQVLYQRRAAQERLRVAALLQVALQARAAGGVGRRAAFGGEDLGEGERQEPFSMSVSSMLSMFTPLFEHVAARIEQVQHVSRRASRSSDERLRRTRNLARTSARQGPAGDGDRGSPERPSLVQTRPPSPWLTERYSTDDRVALHQQLCST